MNFALGGDHSPRGGRHLEQHVVEAGKEAEPGQLGGGGGGGPVLGIAVTESEQGRPEPVLPLPDVVGLGGEVGPALLVKDHPHWDVLTVDGHVDDVAEPGQPDVLLTELNTEGGGGQVAVLVHHRDDVIAA